MLSARTLHPLGRRVEARQQTGWLPGTVTDGAAICSTRTPKSSMLLLSLATVPIRPQATKFCTTRHPDREASIDAAHRPVMYGGARWMMNANVGSQHGSLLAPTGHDLTGGSFVAQANYSEAVGQQFVRVVSHDGAHTRTQRIQDPWSASKSLLDSDLTRHPSVGISPWWHDQHVAFRAAYSIAPRASCLDGVVRNGSGHDRCIGPVQPRPCPFRSHRNTGTDHARRREQSPRIALIRADQGAAAPNSVLEITRHPGTHRHRARPHHLHLLTDTTLGIGSRLP